MARKLPIRRRWVLGLVAGTLVCTWLVTHPRLGCEPDTPTDDVAAIRELVQAGRYAAAESLGMACLTSLAGGNDTASHRACILDAIVEAALQSGSAPDSALFARAREALQLKEAACGPQSADLVRSLTNLANVTDFAGDYARARSLYERALELGRATREADHPDVALVHYCYGAMLGKLGEYAGARVHLNAAITSRERRFGADHPEVATALNTLGVLCAWSNDFVGARRAYERCLAIRERVRGPNHPEVAGALNNLAAAAFELGDYAEARRLWTRALAIREKSLPRGHPRTEGTRTNLATLAAVCGDLDTARRLYAQAIATVESHSGPQHPLLAEVLHEAGAALLAAGDTVSTRQYLERAMELDRALLPSQHPDVALCLRDLGRLAERCGNHVEARTQLEAALAIQERVYGWQDPQVARTQCELATVCARLGDWSRGLETSLAAEEAAREHLRLTARSLSEYQALRYESTRAHGLDVALGLGLVAATARDGARPSAGMQTPVARCWEALIRSRSLVLDELAARQRLAASAADSSTARLAAQLGAARRTLANLVIDPPALAPEARRMLVDSVAGLREDIERRLAAQSAPFRAAQARDRIGLQEVVSRLEPGDALLAYVVYEGPARTYAALLIGARQAGVVGVRLGHADSIDAAAQRWMQEVRRDPGADAGAREMAETSCRRSGETLRQLVWDPVLEHVGQARRLFVVPDGILQLVNLGALPAPRGGYLVEHPPLLHILSTERDLVPMPEAPRTNVGLLALGGPDFDVAPNGGARRRRQPADDSSLLRGVRFAALPAARREAEEVLRLWRASAVAGAKRADCGACTCLVGREASEGRFKHDAPGKQVIHLATHGFFLGAGGGSGGEAARGMGTLARVAPPRDSLEAAQRNPLLRAGLALAGANLRAVTPGGEDGILTAEEIAALDLRGVEWAVLSACDTGLGTVQAREGIFGLRRAFQIAGARTVIASLWAVRDDRARAWMAALYRARYVEHRSTAASVREACIGVLADLRARGMSDHPYLWAGFVAVGD